MSKIQRIGVDEQVLSVPDGENESAESVRRDLFYEKAMIRERKAEKC